ncbi:hypothetical protein AAG565_05065 [Fontimonas sp. SYSU GA230001]|uniref:hypothetical protein n=1 Tax=Fontimonas sp. SYSU GA230001 TaxID=3142450 RepID=UPI0032B4E4D0
MTESRRVLHRGSTSPAAAVMIAVVLVAIVQAVQVWRELPLLIDADLPNPDSYYRLVLLRDRAPSAPFNWVARDNAPDGSWVHWSLPYSVTLWASHRPLRWLGIGEDEALRYAGGALTVLSVLLVAGFVGLAATRIAPARPVMVTGLVLASSVPMFAYGRVVQITHHIFMLVPLAAAAACLLQPPQLRRPSIDVLGGALLGLALWVSPETMPFLVGLAGVRLALRLQHAQSAALGPIAAGLVATTLLAWTVDPPPPGFSVWALDHISLAYVSLVVLLAGLLAAGDLCASRRVPLRRSLPALVVLGAIAVLSWLLLVPGARQGPQGLVPDELSRLFWGDIVELRGVRLTAEWIGFLTMPLAAAALAAVSGWRQRSLWHGALAMLALGYALLGIWHMRMGAAASVAAALAIAAGAATMRAMDPRNDGSLSARELGAALCVALLPHAQLIAYQLSLPAAVVEKIRQADATCSLAPIADTLNRLPSATFLTPLVSGPEFLYRTHHRVIAGPYHHNADGMLDSFRAWLDAGDGRVQEILRRRGIGYVLGCVRYQAALQGEAGQRTLMQRVVDGDVPEWLEPMPWPAGIQTGWRLYRVSLAQ